MRPETLLELGREYGVTMPRDDAEALREYMIVRDAHNLEEYLARFATTLSVMQTAEALERIAYELAEDAAREGVRYLEVRFAPKLNTRGGLTSGAGGGGRDQGPGARRARARDRFARDRLRAANAASRRRRWSWRDSRSISMGAASWASTSPAASPGTRHRRTRRRSATRARTTCRARATPARATAPGSVREAVHACCASRIGHGTRLIEDSRAHGLRQRPPHRRSRSA